MYTLLIILIYLVGGCIPLYHVDMTAYTTSVMDAQTLLIQSISGDMNRTSIFALGVSSYMIASIIVQIITVYKNAGTKSKTSPHRINQLMLGLTFLFALIQAVIRVNQLQFTSTGTYYLLATKIITVMEMVTGVMLILWLCVRNKKYGVGGQTAIIFVNIINGIMSTINSHTLKEMILPLIVSSFVMVIVMVMENTEKQIPLQRVSIHNIYADKNYLAIKLNPIGIMPVMFATGFFMIPQFVVITLRYILPEYEALVWMQENMSLNKPLGIGIYISFLYLLTIGFSMIFVNPKEITENFLKSGDSIENIHAGKDTRRYLSRTVRRLSFLSATVMSICIGIPMLLQLKGQIDSSLVMFPSSIMMLVGMWSNIYQEMIAVHNFDKYKSFI